MKRLLLAAFLALAALRVEAQVACVGSGCSTGSASDATLIVTDVATNDVSTSKHGFAPKAPGDATKYLNGLTGSWVTPSSATTDEIGTLPTVTGLTVSEWGNAAFHRTVFTFDHVTLPIVDTPGTSGHGGLKIYSFPLGKISAVASMGQIAIARVGTNISATTAVVMSVGSTAAGSDNATLTSTEVDYLFSVGATLSSGAGLYSTHQTGSPLTNIKDGTTTGHSGLPYDIYLNAAIPDAASAGDDALTCTGTFVITWTKLANY